MIDLELTKQQARDAFNLLDTPIFKKAITELTSRLTGALMACSDQNKQIQLVSELKAIKAIEVQLISYVNEGRFTAKRKVNARY